MYASLKNIRAESSAAFHTLVAVVHPRYQVVRPAENQMEVLLRYLPHGDINHLENRERVYNRVWQIWTGQARDWRDPMHQTIQQISSELPYNKLYLCVKDLKQESEEAFQTLCKAAHEPEYVQIPSLPILRVINKYIMGISDEFCQEYGELEVLQDGWDNLRAYMTHLRTPLALMQAYGYRSSSQEPFQLVHVDTDCESFLSAWSLVIKELKQLQQNKPQIFREFVQSCLDKKGVSMKCVQELRSPSLMMYYPFTQGWVGRRSMVMLSLPGSSDVLRERLKNDAQVREIRIEHPLERHFQGLFQEVYLRMAQLYAESPTAFQILLQASERNTQTIIEVGSTGYMDLEYEWKVLQDLWNKHGLSLVREESCMKTCAFVSTTSKTQEIVIQAFNTVGNKTLLVQRKRFPCLILRYPPSLIHASAYIEPTTCETPYPFVLLDYQPYPSLLAAYADTVWRLHGIQRESIEAFNNFVALCQGKEADYRTFEAVQLVEKYGLGNATMTGLPGFSFRGFILNCTYLDERGFAHIRAPMPKPAGAWTV